MRISHRPTSKFGEDIPFYTGPRDGLSHPAHGQILRPLARRLQERLYHTHVEGRENLPSGGPHVYAPTHPTIVDPLVFYNLTESSQDVRIMANARVMVGPLGKAMTWAGAFPVQRDAASLVTLGHCKDVLEEGKGLCIFPEGGMSRPWGQVGPLKKGAAASALRGPAESAIPIAIHYEEGVRQARPGARSILSQGCKTAVRSALALAGPLGGALSLAWSGATSGAWLGAMVGKTLTPQPKLWLQTRNLGRLAGQGLGWLGGAGLASWLGLGASTPWRVGASLVAGLAGLGLATLHERRPHVEVKVLPGISLDDYRGQGKAGVEALTVELHRSLGLAKQELSGVPYDASAPKLKQKEA